MRGYTLHWAAKLNYVGNNIRLIWKRSQPSAALCPRGVCPPGNDHWTLTDPAHSSGGPYDASHRNASLTNAELEY